MQTWMAGEDPRSTADGARPREGSASGAARTGVLTFHRCVNYGSYWQARCLVEGLRARGADAVVLDHDSRRVNRAERRCALDPLLPARGERFDAFRYAGKVARFARARARLPRSARFPLEEPEAMEPFDRVVVGSDEVWNLSHPWYAGCRIFFGAGVRARQMVAYAASFGNYDASAGLATWWADLLRRFDLLSVRDENSRRLVRSATGIDPALVVDPCLLFPIRPTGRWRRPSQPFVCVYGHSFSREFAESVTRAARASGLRLVSVGYRNAWADEQWLGAGPDDFAHCVARAAAVATNFFHGCVFALANGKPFVCEPMPYRANKILGLLETVDAGRHRHTPDLRTADVERRLAEPPGPVTRRRLDRHRAVSAEFLDAALAR